MENYINNVKHVKREKNNVKIHLVMVFLTIYIQKDFINQLNITNTIDININIQNID